MALQLVVHLAARFGLATFAADSRPGSGSPTPTADPVRGFDARNVVAYPRQLGTRPASAG